jgi:hypothetical protein
VEKVAVESELMSYSVATAPIDLPNIFVSVVDKQQFTMAHE